MKIMRIAKWDLFETKDLSIALSRFRLIINQIDIRYVNPAGILFLMPISWSKVIIILIKNILIIWEQKYWHFVWENWLTFLSMIFFLRLTFKSAWKVTIIIIYSVQLYSFHMVTRVRIFLLICVYLFKKNISLWINTKTEKVEWRIPKWSTQQ